MTIILNRIQIGIHKILPQMTKKKHTNKNKTKQEAHGPHCSPE